MLSVGKLTNPPRFCHRVINQRFQSTLIVVEHDNETVKSSTLSAVTAATQLGFPITCLVAGSNCEKAGQSACEILGVQGVLLADDDQYKGFLAERLTPLIVALQQERKFSHLLAPATAFGKGLMPRVAAKLNKSPVTDITYIKSPEKFMRPIYAGEAFATVVVRENPKILTVNTSTFPDAVETGGEAFMEKAPEVKAETPKTEFVGQEFYKSDRPKLSQARVIVSGGNAIKTAEQFKMLTDLADVTGAAVGGSKRLVINGFIPNDLLVGQTGNIVAPDVYFAIGMSGAIQHINGMKYSKTIVAINKDDNSPIFHFADLGLVADFASVLPDLIAKLKK